MELGDAVEVVTRKTGIQRLVHAWLGEECGCEERREKLNQLSAWAKASARLAPERAEAFLRMMIERK